MGAKVVYTQKGSDPATIQWPQAGPPSERWNFPSGTATTVNALIGYGSGLITFADGRQFPPLTTQGSTLTHQKG